MRVESFDPSVPQECSTQRVKLRRASQLPGRRFADFPPSFPRSAWERFLDRSAVASLIDRGAAKTAGSHAERGNEEEIEDESRVIRSKCASRMLDSESQATPRVATARPPLR